VLVAVLVARSADVAMIDPRLEPASVPALVLTTVSAWGITLWRRRPLAGLLLIASGATAVSAAGYFVGASC